MCGLVPLGRSLLGLGRAQQRGLGLAVTAWAWGRITRGRIHGGVQSLTLSGRCGLCLSGRSLLGLPLKVYGALLLGLEVGIYK